MRQACARGLIRGPATEDLREPGAWLRIGAIVRGLRDERDAESLRLRHARALALFRGDLDADAARQLSGAVDAIEDALDRLARPWAEKSTSGADVAAMEAKWESVWGGKMDDPAMVAKIQEACRKLRARPAAPLKKVKTR